MTECKEVDSEVKVFQLILGNIIFEKCAICDCKLTFDNRSDVKNLCSDCLCSLEF